MAQKPSRDETREEVAEPWRLVREWFDAYNRVDVDRKRALAHYPFVDFGGARMDRETLDFRVCGSPGELDGGRRDPNWSHSAIDRWEVRQRSPTKGHVVVDFRRYGVDGKAYGVALSRLAICTKDDGEWGVRVQSSSGLRHPASVPESTDRRVSAEARRVVRAAVEAFNDRDEERVRDLCHFPFVRLDGAGMEIAETPADLSYGFEVRARDAEWHRSTIDSVETLPPQSGDKVVLDVDVERYARGGTELPPEGAIYLATKRDGEWGLQCRSARTGAGGLP